MSSKFRDFRNLVETLEDMGIRKYLEGLEIFLFTKNTVSESISEKGSYTSEVLYDLIVLVFKLDMRYRCCLNSVHVDGTKNI